MTPPAKYDLTELKTRLDIVEVARLCGLDPKKSGSAWVARCPAHDDQVGPGHRPNLALHPTKGAKCFRCGFQADVIGLAVKAKGQDFGEVVDWLASLAGLVPAGEGARGRRSGSGLGYNGKGQGRDMYPKGAPLPPDPPAVARPPAVRIIGDLPPDPGLVSPGRLAVAQDDRRPWAGFDAFDDLEAATGRAYVALVETTRRLGLAVDDTSTASDDQVAPLLAEYRRLDSAWAFALGLVALAGETQAGDDRPTLRVRVFDAFLGYTVPVGEVPRAADWLRDRKGLSVETQTRAGLRWLSDWEAADKGLKAAFDEGTLKTFGLVTDEGRLHFARHRLLFPFWVKGKPVFLQGRNIDAQGDDRRFDNPSGSVPCLYNVDALGEARRTGRPVFVCEGPTDTLTLTQSGRLAVGIVGTQGFKPDWVADLDGLDVFLAFDGDKAGREAAQKVADLFVSEGLPAPKIVKLPDGQDVTDYFTHQRSKTRI